MEWTDEAIAKLRALWAEGLSTAEIGRRLNISKNAVVGKAHRLNLPPRPSPIRRTEGEAPSPRQPAPKRAQGPTLPPLAASMGAPAAGLARDHAPAEIQPHAPRPAAGRSASPASRASISAMPRPCRANPIATTMPPSPMCACATAARMPPNFRSPWPVGRGCDPIKPRRPLCRRGFFNARRFARGHILLKITIVALGQKFLTFHKSTALQHVFSFDRPY